MPFLRRSRERGGAGDGDRWLVVGLANPENEYGGTRHNVGADAVRALSGRLGKTLDLNRRVRCHVAEVTHDAARVVLAVPTGYMNECGGPVQQAAAWFKVTSERLVVVHDDIDVAFATLRLKKGGGTAGHNGLRSLESRLGTRDFYRVRIGVGRPPGRMDPADYVLRRFKDDERPVIDVTIEEAADAALALVHDGLEPTQNRFHRSA